MAAKKQKRVKKTVDHEPTQTSNLSNLNGVFFGWKPELPDHRDFPYAAMRMSLERPITLPPQADLRPQCPPVYDQGHLGSCTGNAIAGAFHFGESRTYLTSCHPGCLSTTTNAAWKERYRETRARLSETVLSPSRPKACAKRPTGPTSLPSSPTGRQEPVTPLQQNTNHSAIFD